MFSKINILEGINSGFHAQICIVAEFCILHISWEFILRNCTDCVLIQSIPQGKCATNLAEEALRIDAEDAQKSMLKRKQKFVYASSSINLVEFPVSTQSMSNSAE